MMNNSRILIVDDNTENLSVLGNMLMNTGYSVQVAQNGESAINAVNKKIPDLILLDISMPGLSGFDVCKILKEDEAKANIPVIFLTAHTDTEHIIEGFSLGGVDYITKPFNEQELLSRVKNHLDLKYAKAALEQKNDELKKLNATKDKFFSIIAHDLRSPIASMMAFIEIITKDKNLSEEMMMRLLITQKEMTRNTYNLLENLLNWAVHNMKNDMFEPRIIEINELVNEALLTVEFSAKQKGINIITEFTEKHQAYADTSMINLIIRNLLTNAIKYTPKGGIVKIDIEDNTNELEIKISDTGVGISQENIERILSDSEFYSSLGTNNEKGTGLGTKLIKNFIAKNNGKLKIESELNNGTCISFTLPKP